MTDSLPTLTLHQKYAQAVTLYTSTERSLKDIAGECGVSATALGAYLRRYRRELVLCRNGMEEDGCIKAAGRQTAPAHAKYKEAVAACDMMEYIDLNVSQVARKFRVDGTALANFMRTHYPDIPVRREALRRKLGINDNIRRGARPECSEQYAGAVELYRTSELTLDEVAELCRVSVSGLGQHLRYYHRDIVDRKRCERGQALARRPKQAGRLVGNGSRHLPLPATVERYAGALDLYRETALTLKEIARRTGVTVEGFRAYLNQWHPGLQRTVSAPSVKYGAAVGSLKAAPRPIAHVAKEFGLQAEAFRQYLHKHEPELARQLATTRTTDGRRVAHGSREKYAEAVHLYRTTPEDLKSIARRLGLTYNSVGGYIRRNHPEVIEAHKRLLAGN